MGDLRSAIKSFDELRNVDITKSISFMRDMKTGLVGTFDCTVLKRKMNNLKDSVCLPDNFA